MSNYQKDQPAKKAQSASTFAADKPASKNDAKNKPDAGRKNDDKKDRDGRRS